MSESTSYLNRLGRRLAFYLGGAWVVVESFSFLVQQYDMDPVFIDLIILLIVFGFPATLIMSSFNGRFNWKAVALQIINVGFALGIIFYYVINPTSLNPDNLRILKITKAPKSEFSKLTGMAVLPFLNNMGEDQEFLVSGMHDGLITEIGKLNSMKVISRTSVMSYENSKKNVRQIARELDVDALIETSLTKIDTVITLQMKLINVYPDESILWSHTYEVSLGEVPNLFREVTKNVALKINKAITPEEERRLQPRKTINAEAYEAFLLGNYYTSLLTLEGFNKGEKYLLEAIELDSMLMEGYCGLAVLWASRKQMSYVDVATANEKYEYYIAKAKSIDSNNFLVVGADALHYTWGTFEWSKAGESWRKTLELNPNEWRNRIAYAHYLMIMNDWEEAWEQARIAGELAPESPWVISFTGIMYLFNGKLLSAAKNVERLKKMAPEHPLVTEVYLEKEAAFGNYDQAIEYLKTFMERTQISSLSTFIDQQYAESDFNTTLSKVAERLEEERKTQFVAPRIMGQLYRMLDDKDKSLDIMQQMYEEKDPNFPYFGVKWDGDPYQKDERYIQLMKKAGLW